MRKIHHAHTAKKRLIRVQNISHRLLCRPAEFRSAGCRMSRIITCIPSCISVSTTWEVLIRRSMYSSMNEYRIIVAGFLTPVSYQTWWPTSVSVFSFIYPFRRLALQILSIHRLIASSWHVAWYVAFPGGDLPPPLVVPPRSVLWCGLMYTEYLLSLRLCIA